MAEIIPNSFQTPNVFIDELMAFLTPEEFKILTYITRRIIGFHKRQDRISLSQLCDGITRTTGERLDYGTGLSRDAARRALDSLTRYGLLVQLETASPTAGPLYELQLDINDVDIAGLHERESQREERAKAATTAAREARGGLSDRLPPAPEKGGRGLSDRRGVVCPTDGEGSVAQTPRGLSDSNTKTRENQIENQIEINAGGDKNFSPPLPSVDVEDPSQAWAYVVNVALDGTISNALRVSYLRTVRVVGVQAGRFRVEVANAYAAEKIRLHAKTIDPALAAIGLPPLVVGLSYELVR